MKKRRELLKTKAFWMVKIQNDLYNKVEEYMQENNLTRTQMAQKLGVTKGYLSQVLNGDFNHKLSKLVELSLAIGIAPVMDFRNLQQYIEDDETGIHQVNREQPYEISFVFEKSLSIPLGKTKSLPIKNNAGSIENQLVDHPMKIKYTSTEKTLAVI